MITLSPNLGCLGLFLFATAHISLLLVMSLTILIDSDEPLKDPELCIVHTDTVKNEQCQKFTERRWITVCRCAREWEQTSGAKADTVKMFLEYFCLAFEELPDNVGCHHSCYCKFTHKGRIAAALKRKATDAQFQAQQGAHKQEGIEVAQGDNVFSPKKLRSSSQKLSTRSNVLLPVCIICKEKKDLTYSVNGKTVRDRLVLTQKLDGGNRGNNNSDKSCVAYGCNKWRKKRGREIRSDSDGSDDEESEMKRNNPRRFHLFPIEPQLLKQWIVNIRRKDWFPNPGSKICSDHFKEEDLDRSGSIVRLKKNAVPTRFKALKKLLTYDDDSETCSTKLEPPKLINIKQEP